MNEQILRLKMLHLLHITYIPSISSTLAIAGSLEMDLLNIAFALDCEPLLLTPLDLAPDDILII
jgi:hypothetical protein